MQDAAIIVDKVIRRYKLPHKKSLLANDGVSLQVQSGEIFGLLGPNGAGKTTLVLQILGLLAPTSGSITVADIDVVAYPERVKALCGYMPQSRVAMRNLEVYRALTITGQLRGQSAQEAYRQSEELIELLDLGEHRRQYLDRLSGGMLRAVSLAMALMAHPRILVLDEPTNELDPVRRRIIWDTIRYVNRAYQTTCVLVTHNVLEAEQVIERVAIVDHGRVIAFGTPGALKKQYLSDEMRLDLVFKTDNVGDAQQRLLYDQLRGLGRLVTLKSGHCVVFIPRHEVGNAVTTIMSTLEDYLDDFRVVPASLEDVYIHLANRKMSEEI